MYKPGALWHKHLVQSLEKDTQRSTSAECLFLNLQLAEPNYGCKNTYSGANTRVIVLNSLMRTCSEGPAVSLKGSPTVSPITLAICASLFLPRTMPLGSRRSTISPASLMRR